TVSKSTFSHLPSRAEGLSISLQSGACLLLVMVLDPLLLVSCGNTSSLARYH
ncbi:hypothetical protein HYDPIDRAFT_119764, partial [Hydnomerulius pinastri MD-312]